MVRKRKKRRNKRPMATTAEATVSSVDELHGLVERHPLEAARAISRAQRGEGALQLTAEELDQLSTATAGKLRHLRKFDEARALLRALEVRSTAAQLEDALSAFAMGDDAAVRAIAEQTPELTPILTPLICAASGEAVPKRPRKSVVGIKSLYSAARAVHASAKGDKAAAGRAATAIADPQLRRSIRAATRLAGGKATSGDLPTLLRPGVPELARLAQVAYAIAMPREALDFIKSAEARHHALAALGRLGTEKVDHMVLRSTGPDVFKHPGNAALVLGFESMQQEWTDFWGGDDHAEDDFARALELGADMGECLRATWLLHRHRLLHSGRRRDFEGLRSAAARYARWLEKDPRHAAAHFAVLIDLTLARASQRTQLTAAVRDVRALRSSVAGAWLDTRDIQAELDIAEGRVQLAKGHSKEARALADRACELTPKDSEAWSLALELASPKEVTELAARAYAATGDDEFSLPTPSPFPKPREEFSLPTPPSPAATRSPSPEARLVAEVAETPSLDVAFADIARRSADLSVDARAIFDVAALYVLTYRGAMEMAEAHLEARLQAPEPATDLLLVGLYLEHVQPVKAYFGRLDNARDVAGLADAVVVAQECVSRSLASILLGRLAPWLSVWGLTELQKRLRRPSPDSSALVEGLVARVDMALRPGFWLLDYLAGSDGDRDQYEEEEMPSVAELEGMFAPFMQLLGAPAGEISDERKRAFFETMMADPEMADHQMRRTIEELIGQGKPKRRKTKRKKRKRR